MDGIVGHGFKLLRMQIQQFASQGNIEGVIDCINMGGNVNSVDSEGGTALFYAAYRGHTNTVRFLIDKGANVNVSNHTGYTPLMVAAREGWSDIVQELIAANANIDAKTFDGWMRFCIRQRIQLATR